MFVDVQALDFNFLGRTQAHQRLGDVGNHNRAHDEQHQRDADGLQLLPQLRLEDFVGDISLLRLVARFGLAA